MSDIPSQFKAEMEGYIGTEVKKERDNGDENQGTPRSRKRNQAKKAKARMAKAEQRHSESMKAAEDLLKEVRDLVQEEGDLVKENGSSISGNGHEVKEEFDEVEAGDAREAEHETVNAEAESGEDKDENGYEDSDEDEDEQAVFKSACLGLLEELLQGQSLGQRVDVSRYSEQDFATIRFTLASITLACDKKQNWDDMRSVLDHLKLVMGHMKNMDKMWLLLPPAHETLEDEAGCRQVLKDTHVQLVERCFSLTLFINEQRDDGRIYEAADKEEVHMAEVEDELDLN